MAAGTADHVCSGANQRIGYYTYFSGKKTKVWVLTADLAPAPKPERSRRVASRSTTGKQLIGEFGWFFPSFTEKGDEMLRLTSHMKRGLVFIAFLLLAVAPAGAGPVIVFSITAPFFSGSDGSLGGFGSDYDPVSVTGINTPLNSGVTVTRSAIGGLDGFAPVRRNS